MIGETLGPYRILEQIGAGGMATVYKAYDAAFDRTVALKLLPAQYYSDEKFRQRFAREARAIARLEHLHILPVYATGEDRGHMYMAMRLMTTGSLADTIQQKGPLPLAEAARLIGQIASALDHAHARGVLHRDVKPGNVLLDEARNAYLTDFGIAKVVEDVPMTTTGTIVGTPAYMAPEQCMGLTDIGPAADQYSLAIILYQMLTGRVPFTAETPMAVVLKQMHDPLPLPRQFRAEIPDNAQRVLLKALSKEPGMRFPNCTSMAQAFEQAIRQPDFDIGASTPPLDMEAPSSASLETVRDVVPRPAVTALARRRRGWLWVALPLGLIGVAVIAGLLIRQDGANRPSATLAPTEPLIAAVVPTETPTSTPGDAPAPDISGVSAEPTATATLAAAPTPAGGGGGWIAFARGDEGVVARVRPDGSGLEVLAAAGGAAFSVPMSWSADGQTLALITQGAHYIRENNSDRALIELLRIGMVDPQALYLSDASLGVAPTWSGDGQVLAYQCLYQGVEGICFAGAAGETVGFAPIQVPMAYSPDLRLNADGSRALYPCRNDVNPEVCILYADGSGTTQLTNSPNADGLPVWSPDYSLIAYTSLWDSQRPASSSENTGIYLMNPDGSGARLLTPLPVEYAVTGLGWSADGRTVAYSGSYVYNQAPELVMIDVATGESSKITGMEYWPWWAWSPTGSSLLLTMLVDGYADIFVVEPGGIPANLTNNAAIDRLPAWSPDGTMISFISNRSGVNRLYVMGADGRGLIEVPGTEDAWVPAWVSLSLSQGLRSGQHSYLPY